MLSNVTKRLEEGKIKKVIKDLLTKMGLAIGNEVYLYYGGIKVYAINNCLCLVCNCKLSSARPFAIVNLSEFEALRVCNKCIKNLLIKQ